MAGKITIDFERCKGCGLCVTVCPRNSIVISKQPNKNGYFPAQASDTDCTACANCAIICPEAVITVRRDSKTVVQKAKKAKAGLIEEKV